MPYFRFSWIYTYSSLFRVMHLQYISEILLDFLAFNKYSLLRLWPIYWGSERRMDPKFVLIGRMIFHFPRQNLLWRLTMVRIFKCTVAAFLNGIEIHRLKWKSSDLSLRYFIYLGVTDTQPATLTVKFVLSNIFPWRRSRNPRQSTTRAYRNQNRIEYH